MAKPKDDFNRMRAIAEESGQIFVGRKEGSRYRATRVEVGVDQEVKFKQTRTVSVFYPVYAVGSIIFQIIFLLIAAGAAWLLWQQFS